MTPEEEAYAAAVDREAERVLSETDKEGAAAADAGDVGTVPAEQDPIAVGVTEERVTGWAIFDTLAGGYLEGVRTRPPTDKMRDDLDRTNAEDGHSHKAPRFVWHRVQLMPLEHNAAELADRFDTAAGELGDLEATNAEAGRLALEAVDRETPRRTGTLAAGGRCVADAMGFAYVNATPYAVVVDTRTGFASDTLVKLEGNLTDVYQDHVEASLAPLT